jgi:hypothetical protein
MEKFIKSSYQLPLAVFLLALISRFIPHVHNFAPFGAIALFGATYFQDKKLAFIVPVFAAWISGVILNNTVYTNVYPDFVLFDKDILWQSIAYSCSVIVGFYLLRSKATVSKTIIGALSSSMIFFIITNFGFWTTGMIYPLNPAGLMACFTAALPFYQSTLIGDLIYTTFFFGLYYLITSRGLSLKHVQ